MDTVEKRLLLVMPPQQGLLNGFAAGLISLANFVEARMPDVRAKILDLSVHSFNRANMEITHFMAREQEKATFVGITTTTASYQSALEIARFVKQAAPRAVVVLGGHHASTDPEIVLRSHPDLIDLIVVGEGERSLCELIRHYPSLKPVPGLAFLDDEGRFIHTDAPPLLSQDELDSIPITYGNNGLIGTPGKFDHATYVSARGCPLRCAFCAVGNDSIRAKSIPAVVRDIEVLLDMGFCRIAIEDNFFAHSPSRTQEICEALAEIKQRRNGAFAWDCQTRVESLARKDTIELMAKAGCEAVYIGVESVHPEQLAYLNKTKNPSKYLATLTQVVVPALLDTDIACYLNLQFGLPDETEDHERATCGILASLGRLADARGKIITVFPQLYVVYPGTTHFQQGVSQGRFPRDVFETFTKWEFRQTSVLYWLGEHFAHGTGGIPDGILKPEVLRNGSFEDVDEVVDAKTICRISAALRAIDRIRGVHTFNYGDYIVMETKLPDVTSARGLVAATPI
ncbi:MAG: radical SAM protein [Pseudomonadota bacterium]